MAKNSFLENISVLRGRPGARMEVNVHNEIPDLKVSGSSVPEGTEVGFVGAIEAMEAGQGVVAVGKVKGEWQGPCRRCLGAAIGQIDQPVREIFEPDAVEGETYPLEGELLDLEPLVRETIILELPEAPLCKADCKGLCPTCGANLNETTCDCPTEVLDPRWAALDFLKRTDEDEL